MGLPQRAEPLLSTDEPHLDVHSVLAEPVLPPHPAPLTGPPVSHVGARIESTSRTLLTLFVIGLLAFATGAALTVGVLSGWIDPQLAKDALKGLRALLR